VAARAGRPGLEAQRILVSTTHTHSGPDTWELQRDERPWAARYRELLEERLAEAVREARERARPCHVVVRQARGELGVNRRDPAREVDPRAVLLSLVEEGGGLRGLLFHYSCHLTVLGVDNYRISADWAGPVRRELEEELGVPVAFLQGAEGDIDPRTRGFLAMADPAPARGSSFAVRDKLSGELARALRRGRDTAPLAVLERADLQAWEQELPLRHGALSPREVAGRIEGWKREFADFLAVPVAEVPEGMAINALVKQRCRELGLGPAEVRRRVSSQFAYVNFVAVYRRSPRAVDPARGVARLPVRLADFGGALSLLCVPVEILVRAALDWQQSQPRRLALLCGLSGGWLGYLPHASDFQEAAAGERYETVSTLFAPEACALLLAEAGRRL